MASESLQAHLTAALASNGPNRHPLQSHLDAALASLGPRNAFKAARLLSRLDLLAAPPPAAPPHTTLFYATGFLMEGKGADSFATLLQAIDPARVAVVRVCWDAGSPVKEVLRACKSARVAHAAGVTQRLNIEGAPRGGAVGALLTKAKDACVDVLRVAFAGARQGLEELNFLAKEEEAALAGALLCDVVLQLRGSALEGSRIVLMGHSLGGRVVLHALQGLGHAHRLALSGGGEAAAPPVEHAVLLGAALNGPAAAEEGGDGEAREGAAGGAGAGGGKAAAEAVQLAQWEAAAAGCRGRLYNVYNTRDRVLALLGAGLRRGPVVGVRAVGATRLPVTNVDATLLLPGAAKDALGHGYTAHLGRLLRETSLADVVPLRALPVIGGSGRGVGGEGGGDGSRNRSSSSSGGGGGGGDGGGRGRSSRGSGDDPLAQTAKQKDL